MAINVNWGTDQVIFIPKADLTIVQASPEVRELVVNDLHLELRSLEASVEGAPWPTTHKHTGESLLSGITYGRVVEVLAPYTVEFEAGTYGVLVVGGNTNLLDRKVPNQTSMLGNNSAGLVNLNNILATISYQGSIWVSGANGSPGRIRGVNGTPGNPVGNLADANQLLIDLGLRSLRILDGDFTLISDYTTSEIIMGAASRLDIGGFSLDGSTLIGGNVTGDQGGVGPCDYVGLELEGVTNFRGKARDCGLSGNTTLATGTAEFYKCHSDVVGISTPSIDFVGPGRSLGVRQFSGGMTVLNMADPSNVASLDFVSGQMVIAASCSDGTLGIRDSVDPITNNSTGTNIVTGIAANQVWKALQTGNVGAGTMGGLLDGTATILDTLRKETTNRTEIDMGTQEEVVYDDDGTTVIQRWDVATDGGEPATTQIGVITKRGPKKL